MGSTEKKNPRGARARSRSVANAEHAQEATPPFLEFWNRTKGSLPEIVGERDLDTVNLALGFLFLLLRRARLEFDQGGDDGGRAGAFTALGALQMFVSLFKEPLAESLQVPILKLQDALVGLDDNRVAPMLAPVPRSGRAPSSQAYATLKGHAAGTVKRLAQAGVVLLDARRKVAKRLNKLGVRPERGPGHITASTIRNWSNDVSADVARQSAAALMYDSMFTLEEDQRFSTMSKAQAEGYALETLTRWVQSIFPELQKAG